jgi:glucose-6-phosphate 1-dehydrogenase
MPDTPVRSDALVFLGATGDLAYKKIFPALQSMIRHGRLDVPVIGVAKAGWNLEQFRDRAKASLAEHGGGVDAEAFAKLLTLLRYVDGDYNDPATFDTVRKELGPSTHPLHYLAIPQTLFATVVEQLDRSGCAKGARVVLEKPFGRDLESAKKLNQILLEVFAEADIFRIDHYLGKEAVQNLIVLRFANSFLEPIWNRHYIESVQITMAEEFGIQGRGAFYDGVGATRDVVQNHIMQLLSNVAMEPPPSPEIEDLRDERVKVLKSVQPVRQEDVVLGQFRGYHEEPGVQPDSQVETFTALRLWINSWRWRDVPFFVRTGKHLPITATEIVARWRQTPAVFSHALTPQNYIRFRVGPDPMIAMGASIKEAGEGLRGHMTELAASHRAESLELLPYEELLGDAMHGNPTWFARQDYLEESWRIIDPIFHEPPPTLLYEPGTWGPEPANDLMKGFGGWQNPK